MLIKIGDRAPKQISATYEEYNYKVSLYIDAVELVKRLGPDELVKFINAVYKPEDAAYIYGVAQKIWGQS
jgi:hypothetical protein